MPPSKEKEGRETIGTNFPCLLSTHQEDEPSCPLCFLVIKSWSESWSHGSIAFYSLFHKPIHKVSSCGEILYCHGWHFLVLPPQKTWITIWPSTVYFFRYIHTNSYKILLEWHLDKVWTKSLGLGLPPGYFLSFCSEKTEQDSCPSDPLYPPIAVLINLVILFCLALVQKQTCWMKGSFGIIYQCNSGNSGLNSSSVLLPSETTMSSYLIGIIWHMFP